MKMKIIRLPKWPHITLVSAMLCAVSVVLAAILPPDEKFFQGAVVAAVFFMVIAVFCYAMMGHDYIESGKTDPR